MVGQWEVHGFPRCRATESSKNLVCTPNTNCFTHKALIRRNKKGISGKRQLLMKTGCTPGGSGQGPALDAPALRV